MLLTNVIASYSCIIFRKQIFVFGYGWVSYGFVISSGNNVQMGKRERSGSRVEFRILDQEDPGSNPVLRC